MPLYEYQCPSCRSSFEAYLRSWNEAPACPTCGSSDVDRQVSSFAVVGVAGGQAASPSTGGGSCCGRGGCGCHS